MFFFSDASYRTDPALTFHDLRATVSNEKESEKMKHRTCVDMVEGRLPGSSNMNPEVSTSVGVAAPDKSAELEYFLYEPCMRTARQKLDLFPELQYKLIEGK